MPTEPDLRFDLGDEATLVECLTALDDRLASSDVARVVTARASFERWPELVRFLCELRGRGVMPLVTFESAPAVDERTLIDRLRFLADWDQCSLENVLVVVDRWLPDACRSAVAHEARIEALFFREWAAAASDARLTRYPALPWRRFLRNVNEENFRFAEACVLSQNDPAALTEAVRGLLELKRKTVNRFPKKWGRTKTPAEERCQ